MKVAAIAGKIFIIRQLTLELRFNGHNYYLVQHGFVS